MIVTLFNYHSSIIYLSYSCLLTKLFKDLHSICTTIRLKTKAIVAKSAQHGGVETVVHPHVQTTDIRV